MSTVGEHSGDTSHGDCPCPCLLGFLTILACLPLSQQTPAHEFSPDLGAVSKALSMGGAFRWGCGSMKAAGGVVSIKPQKDQGEMLWGKEGDPCLQNHLVVKNNQCLGLSVASSYRMLLEEPLSFWSLPPLFNEAGAVSTTVWLQTFLGSPSSWRWATAAALPGPAGHLWMLGWKSQGLA